MFPATHNRGDIIRALESIDFSTTDLFVDAYAVFQEDGSLQGVVFPEKWSLSSILPGHRNIAAQHFDIKRDKEGASSVQRSLPSLDLIPRDRVITIEALGIDQTLLPAVPDGNDAITVDLEALGFPKIPSLPVDAYAVFQEDGKLRGVVLTEQKSLSEILSSHPDLYARLIDSKWGKQGVSSLYHVMKPAIVVACSSDLRPRAFDITVSSGFGSFERFSGQITLSFESAEVCPRVMNAIAE